MNSKWTKFYKRWIAKIHKMDNQEEVLNKILNKYGNRQNVGEVLIFSVIYEYVKCYGKLIECDDIFEDLLEDVYTYKGHSVSLMFSEPAYITIY